MNECSCSRPTDLFLCNECVRDMVNDLRSVPDLISELTTTGAKLDVTGTRGGGSSERPMGVNVGALECKGTLEHLLLAMWMRVGLTGKPLDAIAAVEGIEPRIHVLAGHKSGPSYREQLKAEKERGWNIVDSTSNTVRLGTCLTPECGDALTVDEHDMRPTEDQPEPATRCTTCGESYVIAAYLEARTTEALGHDGTPMRAAQAVRYLNKRGVKVTTKDVENWVAGKRLIEVGHDDSKLKRRLFKLEDVYTLALTKKKPAEAA